MRGLEQRRLIRRVANSSISFFDIISRSQPGYRDLIASFDDVSARPPLDGQIRAVPHFSALVARPFRTSSVMPLIGFLA